MIPDIPLICQSYLKKPVSMLRMGKCVLWYVMLGAIAYPKDKDQGISLGLRCPTIDIAGIPSHLGILLYLTFFNAHTLCPLAKIDHSH